MNEHRVSWPMRIALTVTAAVWGCGCWWSFTEQTAFATSKGFEDPHLLPLIIDGFAAAVAMVAYAASLDGRPAIGARLGTLLAVAGSAASNATWAWTRSGGEAATIAVSLSAPLVSAIAFEVILGELRRQTMRRRGEKPPIKIPYPRLIRLVLNPLTFFPWRRLVLELTDPARDFVSARDCDTSSTGPDVDNINASRPQGANNISTRPAESPEPAVLRSISIRAADEFPVRSRRSPVLPGIHRELTGNSTGTSSWRRPVPATPDIPAVRPLGLIDPATMAPFAWPVDGDPDTTGSTPALLPADRDTTRTPTGTVPSGPDTDPDSPGSPTEKARLYWDNERAAGRTPSGADLDEVAGTKDYGRKLRKRWLAEEGITDPENGSDPRHSRPTGTPTGTTPAAPGHHPDTDRTRPGVLPVPLSTNGHRPTTEETTNVH